ncbi:hypothetical protein D3C71_2152290 [compost metagenome]
MDRQKTDSSFVVGINIQTPDGHRVPFLIHHHLMVGQRIPGVTLRPHRLMQRLAQHFPAELVIDI